MCVTEKVYVGCCVQLNGRHVTDMVDQSRTITDRTFRKHITKGQYNELELALGYRNGTRLFLSTDYAVSFSKSKYRGRPCVYVTWSAIEHVFAVRQAHGTD